MAMGALLPVVGYWADMAKKAEAGGHADVENLQLASISANVIPTSYVTSTQAIHPALSISLL